MDISDILAEVDNDAVPQSTRDLQELTRAWVTERSAPEILPWPSVLIDRVLERIKRQIELVEEETGNLDPKSNFRLIILQTELERFKYLLRSFLRARIAKIDKYAAYYLTEPSQTSRLSPSEHQYLTVHQSLLHTHFRSSFLNQCPQSLQRLDDNTLGISMIDQPDVDKAVFVRAVKDVDEAIYVDGTDTYFAMKRGDIYVVRWSAIRSLILEGDVELL